MTTYDRTRIQLGMVLVDREYPDWVERIDTDALDMASLDNCIGGQLELNYWQFSERFGLKESETLAAAFNADHPDEAPLLTAAWKQAITERRVRVAEREMVPA